MKLVAFIQTKPYKFILLAIPFVILLFSLGIDSTIDMNVHDTYFVIDPKHLGVLFSLPLVGLSFVYWVFRKWDLSKSLTLIHTLISVFGIMSISFWSLVFLLPDETAQQIWLKTNQAIWLILTVWTISQLLLVINLLIGLSRKISS
jgi:hypothetical protein